MAFLTADLFAYIYSGLTLLAIAFQLALAAGAPWGHLAMGGKFPGKLPLGLRVAAIVQTLLLGFLSIIVLIRAGFLLPEFGPLSEKLIWFVVAVSAVSATLNLATPSKQERLLWAPVTLLMLLSSLAVALSK